MLHRSITVRWPRLVVGMALTLVAALSVHVVLLQGLDVPYPDNSLVGWPARYLNVALAMLATILFVDLAAPRLVHRSWLFRSLLLFLIFSMLHEAIVRSIVMDAITTTAWTFSLLKNLPVIISNVLVCTATVLIAPKLERLWQKIVAAMMLAALLMFVCQPLLGQAFSRILQRLSFLAHADVYTEPYGWHVLVPAYVTFVEPVVASFAIAFLAADRLSTQAWTRTLQLVLLIMMMKGSIVPTLIYSLFLKLALPTAIMSEGQFGLEALTLAVMTALVWQHSRMLPKLAVGGSDPASRCRRAARAASG